MTTSGDLDRRSPPPLRPHSMPSERFKQRLFRIVSAVAFGTYGRFPVFGALRASVGVIRNGDRFLAIDRSDGRGYCFPGGLARPWEKHETALVREIAEETGLSIVEAKPLLHYFSRAEIPCHIAVFEVRAMGAVRSSWEGSPLWVTFSDLRSRIVASQRPVLDLLIQERKVIDGPIVNGHISKPVLLAQPTD